MSYNRRTENSKDRWETPRKFFDVVSEELNGEYSPFTLDAAAASYNALVPNYFTKKENGLLKDWSGHRVWCNPPYKYIEDWVVKCYYESLKTDTAVVLLMPNRTDTRYFHKYCMKADKIYAVKGRIHFLLDGKLPKNTGPNFGSLLICFGLKCNENIELYSLEWKS